VAGTAAALAGASLRQADQYENRRQANIVSGARVVNSKYAHLPGYLFHNRHHQRNVSPMHQWARSPSGWEGTGSGGAKLAIREDSKVGISGITVPGAQASKGSLRASVPRWSFWPSAFSL